VGAVILSSSLTCEAANSQLSTTLPSSLSVSPIEMNHKHHVHHGDVPFAFCALPAHSGERRAAVDEGSTYYSSNNIVTFIVHGDGDAVRCMWLSRENLNLPAISDDGQTNSILFD
jgi:hypothetical protein